MVKRAIAAFLLVAMSAWSEMVLAPMLTTRAGHMHPAHAAGAEPAEPVAGHHHGAQAQMSGKMPCCPRVHAAEPEVLLVVTAGEPPCSDAHRCCFQQGPQSVPAPAGSPKKLTREIAPAMAAVVDRANAITGHLRRDTPPALHASPNLLGMILRV